MLFVCFILCILGGDLFLKGGLGHEPLGAAGAPAGRFAFLAYLHFKGKFPQAVVII